MIKASEIAKVFAKGNSIDKVYKGDEQIFPLDYIRDGLVLHFDGIDNEATGTHNNDATKWIDLVGGIEATLTSVVWTDNGLTFSGNASRVTYNPLKGTASIPEYTITTVVKMRKLGTYPRMYGEQQFPSLYAHNVQSFQYSYYGQGSDVRFQPVQSISEDTEVLTIRKRANSRLIELFKNGVVISSTTLANNGQEAQWKALQVLGNRDPDYARGMWGTFNDMKVYTVALSDEQIMRNYLVDKERYVE